MGIPILRWSTPSRRIYFPACTMPLSCTSPTYITPEILRNRQYAKEYLEHVALVHELLDQSNLSTNHALLSLSNNRLLQSLSGLLTGSSDYTLTRNPFPCGTWSVWSECMKTQTDGKDGISINMPCAPTPVTEGEAPAFMHKSLVTLLTGNQTYLTRGGLIPHLTRRDFFGRVKRRLSTLQCCNTSFTPMQ